MASGRPGPIDPGQPFGVERRSAVDRDQPQLAGPRVRRRRARGIARCGAGRRMGRRAAALSVVPSAPPPPPGRPASAERAGRIRGCQDRRAPHRSVHGRRVLISRIALAMTIHNHQPVGNFGWVIEETYERAYLPMLAALERHPGVRIALHYTGPLLDWLGREQPEFLARLGGLVARDQVEIVGGGWYEPVLAALPERDRLAQLTRMADELERRFGLRPRGAWLAERVWEPDLPTALAGAGYAWTILDDAHFRGAAIPEEALWGPYVTDDQGRSITVWGTEQGLRYRIPFRPVDEVIAYLQEHATEDGDRVGTMGDDGEKFGAWPTTYEECWTNGWVDGFFSALEANADW